MPSNIHNIWEYKQIIKSINPMDFPPSPQEVATPLILLVIGRFKCSQISDHRAVSTQRLCDLTIFQMYKIMLLKNLRLQVYNPWLGHCLLCSEMISVPCVCVSFLDTPDCEQLRSFHQQPTHPCSPSQDPCGYLCCAAGD